MTRFDEDGSLSWEKSWSWSHGILYGNVIKQTTDGAVIFVGSHHSEPYPSYIIKLDSTTGHEIWSKALNNTDIYSLHVTDDNEVILIGTVFSTDEEDILLTKLDKDGVVSWSKALGWSEALEGLETGIGHSVCQSKEGDFIVTGNMYGHHGISTDAERSIPIIKLSESGELMWIKSLVLSGSDYNYAKVVQSTQGDGLVLVGYYKEDTHYNGFITKLDSSANVCWAKAFGHSSNDYACDVKEGYDGTFTVVGYSEDGYGQGKEESLIMQLDQDGMIEECTDEIWDVDFDISEDLSYYFSVVPLNLVSNDFSLNREDNEMIVEIASSESEETLAPVCETNTLLINHSELGKSISCTGAHSTTTRLPNTFSSEMTFTPSSDHTASNATPQDPFGIESDKNNENGGLSTDEYIILGAVVGVAVCITVVALIYHFVKRGRDEGACSRKEKRHSSDQTPFPNIYVDPRSNSNADSDNNENRDAASHVRNDHNNSGAGNKREQGNFLHRGSDIVDYHNVGGGGGDIELTIMNASDGEDGQGDSSDTESDEFIREAQVMEEAKDAMTAL